MACFDLTQLDWTLEGWEPNGWRLGRTMETNTVITAAVRPIPARLPGSVQSALIREGIVPDWYEGLHSRDCEWVEHRNWIYEARLPAGAAPKGERVVLAADGLDYSGWILVDRREVASFSGALLPHRIDLTEWLSDGESHLIGIVFDLPPAEQGQMGYTCKSRYYKPRYNYGWDWCPRLVPIGVTGPLRLVTGAESAFAVRHIAAELLDDNRTGRVAVRIDAGPGAEEIRAELRDGDRVIGGATAAGWYGEAVLTLEDLAVEPWWPNGMGPTKTYTLALSATNAAGESLWTATRRLGFKRVAWLPCEGAPEGAEPWLCEVNGEPVFLQGVNWVPPCASYGDSADKDYSDLITLYRDMGCNIFRVWGGGILETETFYRLCDEAGILVWQEFPLSSSGINNTPPDDPEAIADVVRIAETYIERRAHHVSLLMWCGGNELTGKRNDTGADAPVDYSYPCIAALRDVVQRRDPFRRFVATSPTGPVFYATPDNYGKGIHHDVHGPWGFGPANGGFRDVEAWRAYWDGDDALFRSEVGMPAAATRAQFDRYSGGLEVWPPTSVYWLHSSSWWLQWDRYEKAIEGLEPDAALDEYIRVTQDVQAQAYAIAAATCKRRFPACGGFIIWMGHDCFPCPANNSVIDFMRNPKPAYHALREVFTGKAK